MIDYPADRVVDEITSAGKKAMSPTGFAYAVQADVTKKAEVEGLFVKIQTFGKLNILANNAGIYEYLHYE